MRALLAGQHVAVIGSAPTDLGNLAEEHLARVSHVVGVNGSLQQAIALFPDAERLLVVDAGIFSSQRQGTSPGVSVILQNGLLRSCEVNRAFVVRSNATSLDISPLDHISTSMLSEISRIKRARILNKVTGLKSLDLQPRSLVGTGVFAIALALFMGASSVLFTGFRLRTGTTTEYAHYYYSERGPSPLHASSDVMEDALLSPPRNHSAADACTISAAWLRGADLITNEKDFEPLITNWGASPGFNGNHWRPFLRSPASFRVLTMYERFKAQIDSHR